MRKPVVVLLHLGYWTVFLFLLLIFYAFFAEMGAPGAKMSLENWTLFMLGFAIIPGIAAFYSFYTFLFDRFLNRKKFAAFFGIAVPVVVISALLGWLGFIAFKPAMMMTLSTFLSMTTVMCIGAFLNGVIGLVMKGFITWYGDIKVKEELRHKNSEMEMALLKSQINPHFLFNTINNIDVLISKDAVKASLYLNKLSDIMRFMLYETSGERILLSKELSYIEKYIELQKIRSSNEHFVNYSAEGASGELMIAPMLFIPFIENAFKHTENKKEENALQIRITIKKETVIFECENRYSHSQQVPPEHGGLGNELIRKRLELLYGKEYSLAIADDKTTYNVKLSVPAA